MMSEKKFKVGDRVRYISPIPHYLEDYIERGDECIVSEITDCGYYVTKTCESLTIESDELELIEPTDPRTAFLQELKSVLERHNANIYPNGCVVDGIGFKVGDEDIYYDMNYGVGDYITVDNIMGYEKE